jgi:hypothetical protein
LLTQAMASPTSSSSSSPVHKFSLVDPSTHSPAVLQLIDVRISRDVVGYAVDIIIDTVDYALGRPSTSKKHLRRPEHIKFTEFVASMLERAEVTMPTLLVTLVYIQRAKFHLHIGLEQWALERVFLGALIVASKYLNDSTLKNVHWSMCTGIFGKRDIGRIEREYLDVLNFELKVTEDDILSHHQGLTAAARLPPSPRHSPRSVAMRLSHHTQQPAPIHTYVERRHAHHHHRRRHSPPQPVPELQPISPASSSSSSSSSSSDSFGPATPEAMDDSPPPHPTALKPPLPTRKVLGLDASQFQSRTIDIIRRFPQIPRVHA